MFSQSVAAELRHHPALANLTISLGLDPEEVAVAMPSMGAAVLGGLVGAADAHRSITPLADALLITPYESVSEALGNLNQLQSAGNDLLDGLFRDKRGRAVIAIAQESGVATSAVGRLFPFVAPAVIAGLRAHVRRTGLSAEALLAWIRSDLGAPAAPDSAPESIAASDLGPESIAGPDPAPDSIAEPLSDPEPSTVAQTPSQSDPDPASEPAEVAATIAVPEPSALAVEPPSHEPGPPTLAELVSMALDQPDTEPGSAQPAIAAGAASSTESFESRASRDDAADGRLADEPGLTPGSLTSETSAQSLASIVPTEEASSTDDGNDPVPVGSLAEAVPAVPPTASDLIADADTTAPSAESGFDDADRSGPPSLADVLSEVDEQNPSIPPSSDLVAALVNGPSIEAEVAKDSMPPTTGSALVPAPIDPVEQLRGFPLDEGEILEPIGTVAVPEVEEPEPDATVEEYRDIDHLRDHGEREAAEAPADFSNLAWAWWAIGAVAVVLMMAMVLALAGSI